MKQENARQSALALELTAAKRRLQKEAALRQAAASALKKCQQHYKQLLTQSNAMQERLRHLFQQVLLAQEEERRQISRELHDEISQMLTGINVRLAALKIEATSNSGNLKKKIVTTQRMVERSVAAVHRFARELRPAMLDDLGLIPTLLSFMKDLGKRTGLQIQFSSVAPEKIEQMDSLKRTVLYRVAQEALTNVVKHAGASLAKVSIQVQKNIVIMEISDNGACVNVNRSLGAKRRKGLGILGMRERVEMVGGHFEIKAMPNKGVAVCVRMKFCNDADG